MGVAFQIINDLQDWHGDDHNKLGAAGDVLGGRPTVLLALALQSLKGDDSNRLLQALSNDSGISDEKRISNARTFFEKARVFEQAEKLIEKHRERAFEIADAIEPESLRRLFYYLVDTVLSEADIKKPHSHDSAIVTHSIAMKPPASLSAASDAG
jgi:geranylgeranyl pyrophosphate synthase